MDKRKEILIKALQDRDEETRKSAADALEKLETRDRLELLAKKAGSGEMLDRIRAIYALADLRGPRITAVLVEAMKDPSEDVRAAAIRALSAHREAAALQALVDALKDSSPVVLRVVIDALAKYNDARLLGPLMQMLKNPDQGVVERAVEAVAMLGDKRAEEAMMYFALKGNSRMKGIAIKALGEMDR